MLLQKAYLPSYTRIDCLHLIAGCIELGEADEYLDEAMEKCEQMLENGEGTRSWVERLKGKALPSAKFLKSSLSA